MYADPTGHFAISTLVILGLIAIGAVVGGTVAGVNSYNEGNTGSELIEDIFGGALIGGAIGYFAAPGIATMLSSTGIIGCSLALTGGIGSLGSGIAISTVGQFALVGTATMVGVLSGITVMAAQWIPGSWPGDDPTIPPGDGFEWKGKLPVGGDKGAWVNRITGDSLHPDLHHPKPIGPHWDWINKIKGIFGRIFK